MSCRLGPWPPSRLPHTLDLPPHPRWLERRKEGQGEGCLGDHIKPPRHRGGRFVALRSQARGETAGTGSLHASSSEAPPGLCPGGAVHGTRVRGQGQRCVAVFPDADGAGVRALQPPTRQRVLERWGSLALPSSLLHCSLGTPLLHSPLAALCRAKFTHTVSSLRKPRPPIIRSFSHATSMPHAGNSVSYVYTADSSFTPEGVMGPHFL